VSWGSYQTIPGVRTETSMDVSVLALTRRSCESAVL
jgi:hypothetical protein